MTNINQGDVLDVSEVVLADGSRFPCPSGVAVISQTCDVRHGGTTIVVAPVVEAPPGDGPWESSRFVPLPQLDAAATDLDMLAAVPKGDDMVVASPFPANDVSATTGFSRAVARRFGRFAFPDPVVAALDPLRRLLKKRVSRDGALGVIFREQVVEIRITSETPWWESQRELVLTVLLRPGDLPMFGEPELPTPQTAQWLEHTREPHEIAEKLIGTVHSGDLVTLWNALGDALARRCVTAPGQAGHEPEVAMIRAEILTTDDFTLTMVRNSVQLDFDYMSDRLDE